MDRANLKGFQSESQSKFLEQWFDNSDFVITHTSGSTGKPKEIGLLKSDMVISAEATCNFFNIGKGSYMVNPLSADYIAGKMMIVRALVSGALLWNERPSNTPLNHCETNNYIDLLPVVPSQISGLLESKHLKYVKNLIIGGTKLPVSLENKLKSLNINAYCTYGMTETCSHVAIRSIYEDFYKALPGFKFSVDDRNCLIIESETMSFKQLVTNDIVELHDSISFRWIGRFDNVINSGGIKLFPEQIEAKIESILEGRNFFVTSRDSDRWGNELILVIEDLTEIPDLKKKLSERLSRYEMPKDIIYQERLKKTTSGKIIR